MSRKNPKELKEEYTFKAITSSKLVHMIFEKRETDGLYDKNYKNLKNRNLVINFKEATYNLYEGDELLESGTITKNDKNLIFHSIVEDPIIPVEKEFLYEDYSENYIYLSLLYRETIEYEDRTDVIKYEYTFSANK